MKRKMKRYAAVLAVVCAFGAAGTAMSGCSSDSGSGSESEAAAETAQASEEPVSYTAYNVDELLDDLSNNALGASDKYKDQYVELTGVLSNIDSDGAYISLGRTDGEWVLVDVQCNIMNDEQKSVVMGLSKDDTVTVKGKITSVGEILGYSLDIDEIS